MIDSADEFDHMRLGRLVNGPVLGIFNEIVFNITANLNGLRRDINFGLEALLRNRYDFGEDGVFNFPCICLRLMLLDISINPSEGFP